MCIAFKETPIANFQLFPREMSLEEGSEERVECASFQG